MAQFKGIKHPISTRYDQVGVDEFGSMITMRCYDGFYREGASAAVTPATARQIAAELIRLADEMEGKA